MSAIDIQREFETVVDAVNSPGIPDVMMAQAHKILMDTGFMRSLYADESIRDYAVRMELLGYKQDIVDVGVEIPVTFNPRETTEINIIVEP